MAIWFRLQFVPALESHLLLHKQVFALEFKCLDFHVYGANHQDAKLAMVELQLTYEVRTWGQE